MSDFGLACPRCGEDEVWDRFYGDCYRCGLRGPRPGLFARFLSFIRDVLL